MPHLLPGAGWGVGLGERVALAGAPQEGLHLAPRAGPVQHSPRQILRVNGYCAAVGGCALTRGRVTRRGTHNWARTDFDASLVSFCNKPSCSSACWTQADIRPGPPSTYIGPSTCRKLGCHVDKLHNRSGAAVSAHPSWAASPPLQRPEATAGHRRRGRPGCRCRPKASAAPSNIHVKQPLLLEVDSCIRKLFWVILGNAPNQSGRFHVVDTVPYQLSWIVNGSDLEVGRRGAHVDRDAAVLGPRAEPPAGHVGLPRGAGVVRESLVVPVKQHHVLEHIRHRLWCPTSARASREHRSMCFERVWLRTVSNQVLYGAEEAKSSWLKLDKPVQGVRACGDSPDVSDACNCSSAHAQLGRSWQRNPAALLVRHAHHNMRPVHRLCASHSSRGAWTAMVPPLASRSDVDDPLGRLLKVLEQWNSAEMTGSSINGSRAAANAALTWYADNMLLMSRIVFSNAGSTGFWTLAGSRKTR